MSGRPAVSVVVPTHDKPESLSVVLACLADQDLAVPWELVVVDDGSAPSTGEVLRRSEVPASVVRRECVGRAAARNAGAAASSGSLLVFLDDDIVVGPSFLREHRRVHEEVGADAAVHGALREVPSARSLLETIAGAPAAEIRAESRRSLGTGPGRRRLLTSPIERMVEAMHDGRAPAIAPWLACVGANVSVDRGLWLALGGFDEAFGLDWGCEDLELGYRIVRSGRRIAYAPDALGLHLVHARPSRAVEHERTLGRFRALHDDPAVSLLPHLLRPGGGPNEYVAAVEALRSREPRCAGVPGGRPAPPRAR